MQNLGMFRPRMCPIEKNQITVVFAFIVFCDFLYEIAEPRNGRILASRCNFYKRQAAVPDRANRPL